MLGIAIVRRKFLFGDYLDYSGSRLQRPVVDSAVASSPTSNRSRSREPRIFACVSDFNEAARAFYRKRGLQRKSDPCPIF